MLDRRLSAIAREILGRTERYSTREVVIMGTNERLVPVGDAEICVDTFGSDADPTVLLTGGAASSMDWWEDDFCRRIAAAGRHVVRYDNRDTGRSTSYPVGAPGYTSDDLLTDAIGVLDALDIDAAHIVGISMGGGIAQRLGLDHAQRVLSLTLMSTSPGGDDLPGPVPRVSAMFDEPTPDPDWTDRSAVLDFNVEGEKSFSGSIPVDEDHLRSLAETIVDRTRSIASSMTNHWMVVGGGESLRPRLSQIAVPTLVLHGTEDPLFPYAHGEALAAEIPGATLVPLNGMGHQYPPPALWDVVVSKIVQHTS